MLLHNVNIGNGALVVSLLKEVLDRSSLFCKHNSISKLVSLSLWELVSLPPIWSNSITLYLKSICACFFARSSFVLSQFLQELLEKTITGLSRMSPSTFDFASDMAVDESGTEMPKRRRKRVAMLAVYEDIW